MLGEKFPCRARQALFSLHLRVWIAGTPLLFAYWPGTSYYLVTKFWSRKPTSASSLLGGVFSTMSLFPSEHEKSATGRWSDAPLTVWLRCFDWHHMWYAFYDKDIAVCSASHRLLNLQVRPGLATNIWATFGSVIWPNFYKTANFAVLFYWFSFKTEFSRFNIPGKDVKVNFSKCHIWPRW